MNASELITEVRELLDEPASSAAATPYFTDARLLSWLNQTYYNFCRHTNWTVKMTNYEVGSSYANEVASIADSPIHYLPTDFMKLDVHNPVYWEDTGGDLRPLHEMDAGQAAKEGWYMSANTSGTPVLYNLRYLDVDARKFDGPAEAPTTAPAGAGGFAATTGYKYKYTYYNSTTTQESVVSDETDTGAFSGNATVAVGFTATGSADVDQIRLYRTKDGGSAFFLVTTVSSDTASFNDNMADGVLETKEAFSAQVDRSGYIVELFPYPTAAGNRLKLHYIARPAALVVPVSGTPNSPTIPEDYQWALIFGATMIGKMKRRLFDEATAHRNQMFALFERALSETQDRGRQEFDRVTLTRMGYYD